MYKWQEIKMRDGTVGKYSIHSLDHECVSIVNLLVKLNNIDDYRNCFVFRNDRIFDGTFKKQLCDWYDLKTTIPFQKKPKCPHCGGEL